MSVRRKNIKTWQRIEYIDILRSYHPHCEYCKTEWSEDVSPTLDHIVPVKNGGSNCITNLTLACYSCNNLRGHIPYHIFKSKVTSVETREEYRYALLTEGKDIERVKTRLKLSVKRKEYLELLRQQYGKYKLENECAEAKKLYKKFKKDGNIREMFIAKKLFNDKSKELTATCNLIKIAVNNRFIHGYE